MLHKKIRIAVNFSPETMKQEEATFLKYWGNKQINHKLRILNPLKTSFTNEDILEIKTGKESLISRLLYDTTISFLGIYPSELKSMSTQKLYKDVISNYIWKSTNGNNPNTDFKWMGKL